MSGFSILVAQELQIGSSHGPWPSFVDLFCTSLRESTQSSWREAPCRNIGLISGCRIMILRLRGIASSASYAAVDMFLSSFLVGSVDANAMYMFSSTKLPTIVS